MSESGWRWLAKIHEKGLRTVEGNIKIIILNEFEEYSANDYCVNSTNTLVIGFGGSSIVIVVTVVRCCCRFLLGVSSVKCADIYSYAYLNIIKWMRSAGQNGYEVGYIKIWILWVEKILFWLRDTSKELGVKANPGKFLEKSLFRTRYEILFVL